MTPLRKKMIRELELQRKAPGTISSYVRSVAELAKFHGKQLGLSLQSFFRSSGNQTRT